MKTGPATPVLDTLEQIVRDAIDNQPRSLQKRIGPSEIGNPCDHCLAAKLAGWPQREQDTPWLTTIGTAVHAWLEEHLAKHEFNRLATVPGATDEWLMERRVTVGTIGADTITGSCDLFHVPSGTVIDWKIVGDSTLRKVRANGPSPTYLAQANLYGLGWVNEGYQVTNVAIFFLPRNRASLADAYAWSAPHDPALATNALERANRLAANLAALATVSEQVRDKWIATLPRAEGCWDCRRYTDPQP